MDKDLKKRKKDMYQGLWFGTIALIIIIIVMWAFARDDFEGNGLIWFTAFCIIGIIGSWLYFTYQKEKDKRPGSKDNAGDKVIKASNKIHGGFLKFFAIRWGFLMVFLIGGGIYLLITVDEYRWIGFILIGLGLILIIAVRNLWKIGGQKLKTGRYY